MADTNTEEKGKHGRDAAMERESDTRKSLDTDLSILFIDDGAVPEKKEKSTEEEPLPDLSPQVQLLWALKNNRYYEFVELINNPEVNIKFEYTKPQYSDYGTCIEIASRLPKRGKYVKALLDAGMKPNVHEVFPEPIHYAAREGNPDTLRVLLDDKRTKINAVDSQDRTALHHAVSYSNEGRDDEYAKCITMLLKRHDFDINKANKKGYTAVHTAANTRKEAVVLFLKHRRDDLDLDTARPSGRSARETILTKYPELRSQLPQIKVYNTENDINNKLVLSLRHRDFNTFTQILRRVDYDGDPIVDPNFFYRRPYNATCLEIACENDDCAEFVEQLLDAGADPNTVNPITKQIPLHFAAQLGNEKVVSALLENRRTNINILNDDGKSVLHIIAESEGNGNQLKCLKHILGRYKHNSDEIAVQVNIQDKNEKTAIEIAVIKDKKEFVEVMLEEAAMYLNLDAVVGPKNQTLLDVILNKFPDLKQRVPTHRPALLQQRICVDLFQLLYNRNLEKFVTVVKSRDKDQSMDIDDGNYTLLQYAVLHELSDPVRELLQAGTNPNNITKFERRPPLIIATQRKNHSLLKLFLDNAPKQLDVNVKDAKGNTALHFAAKNEDLDSVIELMGHGADYRIRNVFGKCPLSPDTVSCFLDKCLRKNDKYADDEDYEITFNYHFLLADTQNLNPQAHQQRLKDPEAGRGIFASHSTEMDFLFYISESEEHRQLLKHPIIASFLEMKWILLKLPLYVELFFNIIAIVLLIIYVIVHVEESAQTFNIIAKILLWLYLVFFIPLLAIRAVPSPIYFFSKSENWIKIVHIGCIVAILPTNYISPILAVLTIFVSCFRVLLMTKINISMFIHFQILKTVSSNYFRFLFSYISIILAFAFSFYSLIHETAKDYQENKGHLNKTSGFFMSPWLSIQKVFIMMLGELDASGFIPVIKDYGTCFWLFSLFIFVVAMVLVNLLTGLAVDDIKNIRKKAMEVGLASRVSLFRDLEKNSLILSRLFKKSKGDRLLNQSSIGTAGKSKVFPDDSSCKMIHIYPNKSAKIIFEDNRPFSYQMDLSILREAMKIISNADKNGDQFSVKEAFYSIKENYDQLQARFCKIEEKLGIT